MSETTTIGTKTVTCPDTEEEINFAFGLLAEHLAECMLAVEGSCVGRRGSADEFILMHRESDADVSAYWFKHPGTRNHLCVCIWGAPGTVPEGHGWEVGQSRLHIPYETIPFLRGYF